MESPQEQVNSWLSTTQAGAVSSSTVEFNTAAGRHFAPFVDKMRPAPQSVAEDQQQVERAKFDYLELEDFKFMNYGLKSLVRGEKVLRTIWQPRIGKPILTLGRRVLYQTTLLMAQLTVLTDRELIVIQDDERSKEIRGVRYGGKWRYIALPHISTASVSTRANGLLALSLTLSPGGRQMEILFTESRKQEVARLEEDLRNRLVV